MAQPVFVEDQHPRRCGGKFKDKQRPDAAPPDGVVPIARRTAEQSDVPTLVPSGADPAAVLAARSHTITGGLNRKGKDPTPAQEEFGRLIREVMADSGWVKLLEMKKLRRSYSIWNTLRILSVYPDAVEVLPASGWEKIGRNVKDGAKGAAIMCPRPYNFKDQDDDDGDDDGEPVVSGVRFVISDRTRVYDAADTEGDPLPSFETAPPSGDPRSVAQMNLDLAAVAAVSGIAVSDSDDLDDGVRGLYNPPAKQIELSAGLTPAERAAVLAHELGHAHDRQLISNPSLYRTHRPDCEAVAEAVAWSISQDYNVDTNMASAAYVAGWNPERAKLAKNVLERWWNAEKAICEKLDKVREARMKAAA